MFENQKTFKEDLDAARILNISNNEFSSATDRISNVAINAVDDNVFRPMNISREVVRAFEDNAEKMGVSSPYDKASDVINSIKEELQAISLEEANFPFIENPLTTTTQSNVATGPNTLNLPSVDQQVMTQSQVANQFSNLTMDQKIRLLFPQG